MIAPFSAQRLAYDTLVHRQETTLDLIRHGKKDKDGYWIPGPLFWAWYETETFDPHYLDKGLKSPHRTFPRLPYLPWLFAKLLSEPISFWSKSREMLLSWCMMAYIVWHCQIFPGTQALVQSQKLDKSCELVKGKEPPGYSLTLYNRQDQWLKDRFPLAIRPEDLPADRMVWKNGSEIQAIGRGADQVRLCWRKRVIEIKWEPSVAGPADIVFPGEDVTKIDRSIHAWGYDKAKLYIQRLLSQT